MSVFGKIKSGAGKIATKADKAVDIKRIEMQIGPIKKEIEDQYHKLGQMTYDSNVKKEPENPEAAGIIAKITELKQLIIAKEDEIKKIKEEKVVSQAAAPVVSQSEDKVGSQPTEPSKKFCTNCGKQNDANSKFCGDCGTKMG